MLPIVLDFMASNAVSFLQEELRSQGLFLRSGADFAEFSRSLSGIDRSLTEHFSVQYQTIMPPQGFWIMLTDEWGIPVGTVAARLDDLGPTSLADFWKIYLPRTYTAEDGKPVELKDRQPSFCQDTRGRIIYLGEMWVAERYRHRGVAATLAKLIQVKAFQRFSPVTGLYVWMRPQHASSGFAQACGFQTIVPDAIKWSKAPASRDKNISVSELWLAGNSAAALSDLVYDLSDEIQRGL